MLVYFPHPYKCEVFAKQPLYYDQSRDQSAIKWSLYIYTVIMIAWILVMEQCKLFDALIVFYKIMYLLYYLITPNFIVVRSLSGDRLVTDHFYSLICIDHKHCLPVMVLGPTLVVIMQCDGGGFKIVEKQSCTALRI